MAIRYRHFNKNNVCWFYNEIFIVLNKYSILAQRVHLFHFKPDIGIDRRNVMASSPRGGF